MEIKANLNYLRMSPRKVRLVADAVKGKSAEDAETILRFMPKHASLPVLKLLKSAFANAKHNFNIEKDNLQIQSIRVDKGPTLKRFMPRARGSAAPIRKRSSHIALILVTKNNKLKTKN